MHYIRESEILQNGQSLCSKSVSLVFHMKSRVSGLEENLQDVRIFIFIEDWRVGLRW